MDEQTELGVAWRKVSKAGHEYFSGKITLDGKQHEIVIFYITKRKDKSPWFKIIQSHFEYGNESNPQQSCVAKGADRESIEGRDSVHIGT